MHQIPDTECSTAMKKENIEYELYNRCDGEGNKSARERFGMSLTVQGVDFKEDEWVKRGTQDGLDR